MEKSFSDIVRRYIVYNLAPDVLKVLVEIFDIDANRKFIILNDPVRGFNLGEYLNENRYIDTLANLCNLRDCIDVMNISDNKWRDVLEYINAIIIHASSIEKFRSDYIAPLTQLQIGHIKNMGPVNKGTVKNIVDTLRGRNIKKVNQIIAVCSVCNVHVDQEKMTCNKCQEILSESTLLSSVEKLSFDQNNEEESLKNNKKTSCFMSQDEIRDNLLQINSLITKLEEFQSKGDMIENATKGFCEICHEKQKVLVVSYKCGAQRCCIECIKKHLMECKLQSEPRSTCPHCRSELTDVILIVNQQQTPVSTPLLTTPSDTPLATSLISEKQN